MHGAETQLELAGRPQSFNLHPSSVDHQKRHEPRRGRSARLENQFLRPVRELGPPQREHIRPTAFALSLARLKKWGRKTVPF